MDRDNTGPAEAASGSEERLRALSGVRVLDVATFVAAPFCGTIMADFGAEVIKIEQPEGGDSLRKFGTLTECGDSLVWLSESRNKETITLDLRTPRGAELFRRLVAKSDVILENFRPGTLEKWGLGYEELRKIRPGLVMLRISAYGQTGPKKGEPGFARIAHAFAGLSYLSGEPDGPPVVPGSTSLADYISGMWGAIGVLLALKARDRHGIGQYIDIGLYESVFRLLDEIAPAYARYGFVRTRMGADTVNVVPHSHYQTSSGEWVAIACTNDRMFERLAAVIGRPELAQSPDYATSQARVQRRDIVNKIVADWIGQHGIEEVLSKCAAGGVPCGPVYSIADIFADPQYAARGNLIKVEDDRVGELVLPSSMPRLSETPAEFHHAGRALGADNQRIYEELLELKPAEIRELKAAKVI
jgi:crotonobetainyl-CoA:carnitine CoA-transferase CaiB-like acyl-CoA transferase